MAYNALCAAFTVDVHGLDQLLFGLAYISISVDDFSVALRPGSFSN